MNKVAPLNGTKIHPLSEHALGELRSLLRAPRPRQQINAGVTARLESEGLIETVSLPSPYATHKGAKITFSQITVAGRARLEEEQ